MDALGGFAPRRGETTPAARDRRSFWSTNLTGPKPKAALYGIFRLPVIWRNRRLAALPSALLLVLLTLLCGAPVGAGQAGKRQRFFAVYHATGKRVRDLPITIDKIFR